MTEPQTFGIDLGTTCSAIGLVRHGAPQLIDVDGESLMPSVVSYREHGAPLVGRPALNRLAAEPDRTLRSVKRFMGTNHRWEIDGQRVSAPEASALILARLCDAAEAQLGARPARVVITVPAWFTQAQRADTRQAGQLAGLDVVRIINEPTAAALAHAHRCERSRRCLVYDLGGGTFDVSLIDQAGDVVEVRASHGDTHLGGNDLDRALARRVLARLEEDDPSLASAVEESRAAQVRLLAAVEAAKIELSSAVAARLRVPFLLELEGEPRHIEMELQRDELEDALDPLLERTYASVDQVLADADIDSRQVDELLLVGGSTRIPAVWDGLLARYGLEGNAAISPDRAVALGAAIQAAIVDGSRVDGILVDVAPYSLSVGALAGPIAGLPTHMTCRVVTPRNTTLPSRHSETFETLHPRQDEIHIPVFQGSHANPLRNTILGEIRLLDLPSAPEGRGSRPITVEFRHDLDGMVQIRVTDDLSGRWSDGKVNSDGDEMTELREKLLADLERLDVIPGDGTEADPFALLQAEEPEDGALSAGHAAIPAASGRQPGTLRLGAEEDIPGQAAAAAEDVEIEAAIDTFRAVLERREEFAASHSEQAGELVALARAGLALLGGACPRPEQRARGLECYEDLSDHLFELGIYF